MTYKPGGSLTPQGEWNSSTVYKKGDIVTRHNGSFVAPGPIAANQDPNTSSDGKTPTNGWNLFIPASPAPNVTVSVNAPASPLPGDVWVSLKGG